MVKGFTEEEGNALNSVVRGVVERAIASLMVVGMTHEGALALLTVQAVIRMNDATAARHLLESLLEDGLADDDDQTNRGPV